MVVQGNSSSSKIREVLENNHVTSQTVLGSALMETMMAELSTDPRHFACCPMAVAEKFLRSLFQELNVSASKKEIQAILSKCSTSEPGWFDTEAFRALVVQLVPHCKWVSLLDQNIRF